MEKGATTPMEAPLPKKHNKNRHDIDCTVNEERKMLIFLCYEQDSGSCFVEISPANRKSEINPIGYWVRFYDTLDEALRTKSKIDRHPHLAGKYLNIA